MALDKELLRLYLADPNKTAISDDNLDKIIQRVGQDFNSVLAEGWRVKAATVAEWYEASIDGRVLSRDQVFRHAMKMAEMYAAEAGTRITSFRMEVTPPGDNESEMV